MPLPALQLLEKRFEKQKRIFELRKGALEKRIERHIQLFEQRKGAFEKKIEHQKKKFEQSFESLDDDMRFIRTWLEKPLAVGAVTRSRPAPPPTLAAHVDPNVPGATLGPRPGPRPSTQA